MTFNEEEFWAAQEREMQDERYSVLATPSQAHREWHQNAGVPMGTPGCPQDACHPVDEWEGFPFPTTSGVKCGNKASQHDETWAYHATVAEVRECYEASGRFVSAS